MLNCIILFDSLVKPILLYGSEVWGAYIFRRVDVGKFNEYFLKPVMNDIESTHKSMQIYAWS